MFIHSSMIHRSQKVEKPPTSIYKQSVLYTYNGALAVKRDEVLIFVTA